MSLNEEERKIIVGLEIEKAENIVSQINELEKLSYWDNIANRLYYALFHAVSALLIFDKHNVSTHKGSIVLFGQFYIKTGVFNINDGRLFSQLQTIREKSDYNCAYQTSEDEIKPLIYPTIELIKRIKLYINSRTNANN
ncbi:MAG: HEPN domain-containing protein [Bacteroidales bacterium]|nr:HEPN domain-containing protein [Bacteroidales bacterium]